MSPEPLDDLVRGLMNPRAYARHPVRVEHLQTHISHVFLTGDFAYKVKKAVNLGFLDFSTLEKRRQACEEELRINRRLAPDLYLAVVPITGSAEHPEMEGRGAPIEYAVKMREFDQSGLLNLVLTRGELTAETIDAIAQQLAEFHLALRGTAPPVHCGTSESVQQSVEQNFAQLRPLLRAETDIELLDRLHDWTSQQNTKLDPILHRRREEGFVRECHGDLHLGNLALVAGEVRIFDGIEFNEALRWTDVMSEVAFLVMDLSVRKRCDLAFRFLNQYLEITGDYEGVSVLRYYLVYRAIVRAKVEAIRASQGDVSERERDAQVADCRAHLHWSWALIVDEQSILIVLNGLSGSGKTTHSMTIFEAIGAIRVRSDVERKRLYGVTSRDRVAAPEAQSLYSEAATAQTYFRLADLAERIVQAGFPVIVDATFLERSHRDDFRALAEKLHVRFRVFEFAADFETLRSRVKQRSQLANDASDADMSVLESQIQRRQPFELDERAYVVSFDTGVMSTKEIAEQAQRLLRGHLP